jgi:hypothetical protein
LSRNPEHSRGALSFVQASVPSDARWWINATVILEVVKADSDFADVTGRVGRCSKADKRVHFAHKALGTVCWSEPDLAMPYPRFEVVEMEQGLSIHVHVEAAIALAIRPNSDLNAF